MISIQTDSRGFNTLLFKTPIGYACLPTAPEHAQDASKILEDLNLESEYLLWLNEFSEFEIEQPKNPSTIWELLDN